MLISELEKMTDEELVALSDDDVERIIMYNIAEQGVPVELEPQYDAIDNIKHPLHKFYETELLEDLLFPNADAVDAVCKLAIDLGVVRKATNYKFNSNPVYVDFKRGSYDDAPKDKPVKLYSCYSESEYEEMSDILSRNKRIEAANKAKRDKYNKYLSAKADLRSTVGDIINCAHQSIWDKKQEEEKFKTYLKIAKDDYDMAMAFYMKANNNDYQLKEYLDKVYNKPMVIPGPSMDQSMDVIPG